METGRLTENRIEIVGEKGVRSSQCQYRQNFKNLLFLIARKKYEYLPTLVNSKQLQLKKGKNYGTVSREYLREEKERKKYVGKA